MYETFKQTVIGGFLASVKKFPQRIALFVKGQAITYLDLYLEALRIAQVLANFPDDYCFIYAGRTRVAYLAILASVLAGKAYVPLRVSHPHEKNKLILKQVGTHLMVIDQVSLLAAQELLLQMDEKFICVLPDANASACSAEVLQQHTVIDQEGIALQAEKIKNDGLPNKPINPYAYLLFTSGSTGVPKGVPVTHASVLHYIHVFIERAQPTAQDRFTQLTDLSFDFSVHDYFSAWEVGAAVYVFPHYYLLNLADFVTKHQLTYWSAVPSTALLLNNFRALQPGQFSSLKYSVFCGEVLSPGLVQMWQAIAPHSVIENFYGPTEATICFTGYRAVPCEVPYTGKSVPIGFPFKGLSVILVDVNLQQVPDGMMGELLLSGPQVINGYFNNEKLNAEMFVTLPDEEGDLKRWYRTGDFAVMDAVQGLIYKGRFDDQIQVNGARVEMSEIEWVLKKIAGTEFVAVIPWPYTQEGAVLGVTAYVSGSCVAADFILSECKKYLAPESVPREIHFLAELPYNTNGKLDYRFLKEKCAITKIFNKV